MRPAPVSVPWGAWCAATLCLATWVVLLGWVPTGAILAPYEHRGQWIASPNLESRVTQFRKTVVLAGPARNAWVSIAADEGFELLVNGRSVGKAFAQWNSRPFQFGTSESGQRVGPREGMINFMFPREYQWGRPRTYLVPTFFDIGRLLQSGQNSICIEVESRGSRSSLAVDGEVLLWSGDRVRLDSDASFKASAAPAKDGANWTEPDYPDLDWPDAVPVEAPPGHPWRILDPDVYREPFEGEWLRTTARPDQSVWFETKWRLGGRATDTWVRVLSDRPYGLFVNDVPVRVLDEGPGDQDVSEWAIVSPELTDKPDAPELLSPDKVNSLFTGNRFDDRIVRDPAVLAPAARERGRAPADATEFVISAFANVNGPMNHGQSISLGQRQGTEARPDISPDAVGPKALVRPIARETLFAYRVDRLLRAGENTIALRVVAPDPTSTSSPWPARVAVDGRASLENGSRAVLGADTTWVARTQASTGALSAPVEATPSALATAPGAPLPQLRYRGMAEPLGRSLGQIAASALAAGMGVWLLAMLPGILRRGRGEARPEHADEDPHPSLAVTRLWTFVATSAVLGAALILYVSWGERDDIFLLLSPSTWRGIAATAFAVGVSVPLLREGRRIVWSGSPAMRLRAAIQDTHLLRAALGVVLVGTAVLRLIHITWYPVEDDEAVCEQAAFAVADHGVPGFAPDVFYTRSPGYHYLLGAVVRLLGHNLFAIRLPSVAFSVGTVYLMYLVGERLFGSRWTGLVSGALLAIHPLAIFVGHLGRFYQQQQFFCLLTAYFFCVGFLGPQKPSARLFTIGAFLAACVSQELTVIMVVPLACAYVIFAEKNDRRSTITFWVVGACAAVAFVIDIATYFTICLTKVEGIAPALDATPAPHFANPVHFFTLFVGHSRLHLALSIVLLAGIPKMLASKNGNVIVFLMILFGGVVGVNLLLTTEAIRYLYWLFPFWILLAVHAWRGFVVAAIRSAPGQRLIEGWLAPGLGLAAILVVIATWSPWAIWRSYDDSITSDINAAVAFVRSELRAGDVVAAQEPHPPLAAIGIGRSDYDFSVPVNDGFVYRRDGKMIDRNTGADVISTLEGLQDVIATHDRLWVIVDRFRMPSRGQDVLWDLPAARVEAFLRENFELKYRSFMFSVFLWDANDGHYRGFRQNASRPL